jgi:GPH family glycoside/pentoside/hexuronide:cation symporter
VHGLLNRTTLQRQRQAGAAAAALGQHRHVAKQSPPAPRGVGLGHAFAEAKVTLSNRAFLWLVSAAVFGLINQGLTFALTNYQLGFLWQLKQMEMLY